MMATYMTTISLQRKIPTHAPTPMITIQTIEYCAIRYTITGDVTINPGKLNNIIYPSTGKVQEYRHLMKGTYNPKWTTVMAN